MSPQALPSELWYQDSTVCSLCVFVGGPVRVLPPQVLPSELYHDSTVLALLRRRAGGAPPPSAVHRLGVGTSGLLVRVTVTVTVTVTVMVTVTIVVLPLDEVLDVNLVPK